MNRRELLGGVAATPIAWAWQQYARTHREWTFSGFFKRPADGTLAGDLVTGHYYHLVWSGEQFFIDGVLAPRDDKKWIDMDMEITLMTGQDQNER
jgi:hypothetical protein